MQHCWLSYVASFCTHCYMLLRVVGSCCAKFDTSKTFELTTLKISLICSVIAEA